MRKYENPSKFDERLEKIKVKCPFCGHTFIIPVFEDYKICSYCKKKVDNKTRVHFRFKMRKEIVKQKENTNENKI